MEILINAANILYVTAYFTMDMLRLRLLTMTATCWLAIYFYWQPVPMLNVVAWNVFFIILNLTQIVGWSWRGIEAGDQRRVSGVRCLPASRSCQDDARR